MRERKWGSRRERARWRVRARRKLRAEGQGSC